MADSVPVSLAPPPTSTKDAPRDAPECVVQHDVESGNKHSSTRPSQAAALLPPPGGVAGTAAFSSTIHPEEMRADTLIPFVGGAAPQFAVVHPQGFRILNNASAMERNMRGYFRLPQPPNAATKAEQRRLQRTLQQVEREETQQRARVTGSRDGVVLDGFLILSACEAEDPEEVTAVTLQASQLTSSVPEDLHFFTELRTLDVSDNQLCLGDVLAFPQLETVHLVCNNLASLADVQLAESSSLSSLVALDLAYNRIPSCDLLHLGAFQALRHLDLSSNGLRSLPSDLSSLAQVTHLALESNQLASVEVFHALGTMPALAALNLASNRLSRVPLLRLPTASPRQLARVGQESSEEVVVPFPALQTMTVSGNRFADAASLLPLAALHRTLRHVAVGENPFLTGRPHGAALQLQQALDEAVVDMYFLARDPPSPLPPLSSAGGMADTSAGTWKGKTWVRYLPPSERQDRQEDGSDGEDAVSRSRAASLETATPLPSASAEEEAQGADAPPANAAVDVGAGDTPSPQSPQSDVFGLSVEEYVERYRIRVQCATPPPPPAKQSKRFFYSTTYRATQQEAEGVNPLVTLPPYEEFMDIYRITGRQGPASRRRPPRAASQQQAKLHPAAPTISPQRTTLPVLAGNVSLSPPPPAPIPKAADPAPSAEEKGVAHLSEEDEEESGEDEEGRGAEDGFFLTGVDSEAGRQRSRGTKRALKTEAFEATTAQAQTPPTENGEEPAARPRIGHAAASPANPNSLPRPPLPRSVVSPANTNVHTAMSELRAMLRKPLPSLPYETPAHSRQEQ